MMPLSDAVLMFVNGMAALVFLGNVVDPIRPAGELAPWRARRVVLALGLGLFSFPYLVFLGEGFLNHLLVTFVSIIGLVPGFAAWAWMCKRYRRT